MIPYAKYLIPFVNPLGAHSIPRVGNPIAARKPCEAVDRGPKVVDGV